MSDNDNDEYAIEAYGNKFPMNGRPVDIKHQHLAITVIGKLVWIPIKEIAKLFIRGREMTVEEWKERYE